MNPILAYLVEDPSIDAFVRSLMFSDGPFERAWLPRQRRW